MHNQIRESDWKVFKEIHKLALERYCQRVIEEVAKVAADGGKSHHERYLALFRLIRDRDKELASAFDDFRRSTAVLQLTLIKSLGLLTDDEFARFSPATRKQVDFMLDPSH